MTTRKNSNSCSDSRLCLGCLAYRHQVITKNSFETAFIISPKNGGKSTVDNLKPVCAECSKRMKPYSMGDYIKAVWTFFNIDEDLINETLMKFNLLRSLTGETINVVEVLGLEDKCCCFCGCKDNLTYKGIHGPSKRH